MLDQIHALLHWVFDPLMKVLDSLGLGGPELTTILFVLGVCTSLPWVSIFRKAGYSSVRGYLMLIPVVNIILFFTFAFGVWPIERELRKVDSSAAWRGF